MRCLLCGREHEERPFPTVVTEEMRIRWRQSRTQRGVVVPVPPVYTGGWDEDDWIRWAEVHGTLGET